MSIFTHLKLGVAVARQIKVGKDSTLIHENSD